MTVLQQAEYDKNTYYARPGESESAYRDRSNSMYSTPTPAPAPPPAPDYHPRYTANEQAASDYLSGGSFQAPESVEDIQAKKTQAAQGQIDNLNQHYNDLLGEQRTINEGRLRGTNSVSTLTGLAGSTEAVSANNQTTQLNQRDNQKIQNERAVAIDDIFSSIRTSAVEEAKQSRLEARQSAEDTLKQRADRQTEATTHLTNLSKSGVTADGLKTSDPKSYDYLARQAGGETQLKAIMTLNRPQETVLDKRLENGKYIIAYQNPLDGKVRMETVDLGLPANYTKTVDAGDRILAIPDNWNGDTSQLKSIHKGLTPEQTADHAGGPPVTGPYAGVVQTILGSGKFTKDQAKAIANSINNGEDPATVIKNQAKNIMGQTEATSLTKYESAKSSLQDVQKSLADYYAAGGKTDVFSGNYEKVINKLGTLNDPALVDLATQIQANLQIYRNAVSGTAYSAQEGTDIATIFPGINKTEGLNTAILKGRMKAFDSTIDGTYKATIGSAYDKLKAAEAPAATSKTLVKDGQSFDASALTPEEYKQAIADGYIAQ